MLKRLSENASQTNKGVFIFVIFFLLFYFHKPAGCGWNFIYLFFALVTITACIFLQNAKRSKGDLEKKKKQLRSRDGNQSVLPPSAGLNTHFIIHKSESKNSFTTLDYII